MVGKIIKFKVRARAYIVMYFLISALRPLRSDLRRFLPLGGTFVHRGKIMA